MTNRLKKLLERTMLVLALVMMIWGTGSLSAFAEDEIKINKDFSQIGDLKDKGANYTPPDDEGQQEATASEEETEASSDNSDATDSQAQTREGEDVGSAEDMITGQSVVPTIQPFNGSASYGFPIMVPPGRNGLAPTISLTYNSAIKNTNSFVGLGWNIPIGEIQRRTKDGLDYSKDDYVINGSMDLIRTPDLDVNHKGLEVYRPKTEEAFTRYLYNRSENYWIAVTRDGQKMYFGEEPGSRQDDEEGNRVFKWCMNRVEDPSDNYIEFRYIKDQGQIYIDEIVYTGHKSVPDMDKYSVKFVYDDSPASRIRTYAPTLYYPQFPVKTERTLTGIEVNYDGQPIRSYQLSHKTSSDLTKHILLEKITQYGEQAQPANQIVFQYKPESLQLNTEKQWGIKTDATDFLNDVDAVMDVVDLNGDGKDDFIYKPNGQEKLKAIFGNEDGLGGDGIDGTSDDGGESEVWSTTEPIAYDGSFRAFTDMNNDGRADYIYGASSEKKIYVRYSDENGQAGEKDYFGEYQYEIGFSGQCKGFVDIDGDGNKEFVYKRIGTTEMRVVHEHGVDRIWGNLTTSDDMSSKFAFVDVNNDGVTDFIYGEKMWKDAWVIGFSVILGSRQSIPEGEINSIPWGGGGDVGSSWSFADMNGDGYVDFVFKKRSDDFLSDINIYVLLSTGKNLLPAQKWWGQEVGLIGDDGKAYAVIDVNGDNMADFVYNPLGSYSWRALYSTGSSLVADEEPWGEKLQKGAYNNKARRFADMNGDGQIDFIYNSASCEEFRDMVPDCLWFDNRQLNVLESNKDHNMLLYSIKNSLGAEATISYEPSSKFNEPSSENPRIKMPFIAKVVKSISINDGMGNTLTTDYDYKGAYYDRFEREFYGFEVVRQTNPDNTIIETKFMQDETYFINKPLYQKTLKLISVYDIDDTEVELGKEEFLWKAESYSDGEIHFPYIYKKTSTLEDFHQTPYEIVTEEWHYYNFQNGLLDGMSFKPIEGPTEKSYLRKSFSYENIPGSEYGWLWRITEDSLKDQNNVILRKTSYGYTPNGRPKDTKGKLYSKTLYNDKGDTPVIWMDYDETFGIPTLQKDAKGYETHTYYDQTTKTYPVKIVYPDTNFIENPEDFFNFKYGKPERSIDVNRNTTIITLDEFGRTTHSYFLSKNSPETGKILLQHTIYPQINLNDFSFPLPQCLVSESYIGLTNPIVSMVYADGLGRKLQSSTRSMEGESLTWAIKKYRYDEVGRNDCVTGPFSKNNPSYIPVSGFPWKSYPYAETLDYDWYNRPTSTETRLETGAVTLRQVSYDGPNATYFNPDSGGTYKNEGKDYHGRLVNVTEHSIHNTYGSSIGQYSTYYDYNIAGDLLKVWSCGEGLKNENCIQTTITYNTLGQKVNMTDPDMGYWEYTYDLNGNLETQIDPSGIKTTFVYDELNRVETKITKNNTTGEVLGNVEYVYDLAEKGVGKLYSVSNLLAPHPDGATTVYDSYDAFGNVTKVTKTIHSGAGDEQYITQSEYYPGGPLKQVIYPDNTKIKYQYYEETGFLDSVFKPNAEGLAEKNHAQVKGYDITGKITEIQYGNNVTTKYVYDPYSKRLQSIATSTLGNVGDIMDYAYSYYTSGNIETIMDNNNSKTYEYTYDNINRLKTYNETQQNTDSISYTYTPYGSIETRTVNGTKYTYNYDDPKKVHRGGPHPVKMVSGLESPFDSREVKYNTDSMPTYIKDTYSDKTLETWYTYDGNNTRVRKKVKNGLQENRVDYIDDYYEISKTNGTIDKTSKFIFAGNLRIGVINESGTYYFHQDHLGSLIAITKDNGTSPPNIQSSNAVYDPFGQLKGNDGEAFGTVSNYTFTDQEADNETGLYNYDARLYDPAIGMFLTADTIVPDWSDPQTLNRYSYCYNNPLNYTDPEGHFPFLAAMAIGAVIGAVSGGATNDWDPGAMLMGAAAGAIMGGTAACGAWSAFGGELIGGGIGGYSASVNGGNVMSGVFFGVVVGGVGGYAGNQLGRAAFGPMAMQYGAKSWQAYVAFGSVSTGVNGFFQGATYGYQGGEGSLSDIGRGAAYGAISGSITGAILGGAQFAFRMDGITPIGSTTGIETSGIDSMGSAQWYFFKKMLVSCSPDVFGSYMLPSLVGSSSALLSQDKNIQHKLREKIRKAIDDFLNPEDAKDKKKKHELDIYSTTF